MALVAWYKLNGNVLDSTVNGNHGTIVGSPTVVSDGPFGSCYNFNPENGDYITINNLSSFIYNTPFTFSAWIKTSGLGTGQTVNGIITLTYGTRFCCNSAGNIYITFVSTNIGSYSITSSGVNINDNVWHHVCCTYNGDILKLYIDGNLNVTGVTGIVQTNTYTNNGAIGLDVNDSSKYKFNGSISDVRIYDEALSLKEIKELSKAKVLHYDFNQYQEPTTNLLPTPSTWVSWTLSPECSISSEYLYRDYNYGKILNINADGATTTVFARAITYVSGIQVTYFSFWARKISGVGNIIYVDPDGYRDYSIRQNPDVSPYGKTFNITTEWQKYSFAINTNDSAGNYVYMYFYHASFRDINYQVALPQYELKDHATPFVNGTRTAQVYDKSGYDNNAELALSTTPTYVNESPVGKGCYQFDGSNDNIQSLETIDLGLSDFTLSCWVYISSTQTTGITFHGILGNKGASAANAGFSIYWNNNYNKFLFSTADGTTAGERWSVNAWNNIVLDTWTHIVMVRKSGMTNNGCFYINGIYEAITSSVPILNVNSTYKFTLGTNGSKYSGYYFTGNLQDVRIYATALSEDDIKEIYQTRASIDKNGNIYCNNIEENKYVAPLVDYTSWVIGTSGAQTGFALNGTTTENYIIEGSDPFNNIIPIWEARPDEISDADGGWITSSFNIDNTKLYRFSVWVRRTAIGNGYFFLGVYGYGSTSGVYTLANVNDTNPYFYYSSGLFTNRQDQWLLVVGYVYPYTYTGTTSPADAGIYNVDGTKIVASTTSFKWRPETTTARHRSYLYYSTNIDTRQQWCYPRVDVCDGSEPTITDLLNGIDYKHYQITKDLITSKGINKNSSILSNEFSEVGPTKGLVAYYPLNGDAKDYSGNNNHGTIYGAIKASGIAGKKCYSFDGSDDYIQLPNDLGYTNAFTACAWFKALGTPAGGYHIIFGGQELEISIPTSGALRVGLYTSSRFVDNYGSGLTNGDWHHVCMTFDGTKKKGYIDGILVGEASVTGVLTYAFNRTIGKYGSSSVYYTNGKIQDVRIYNRALSSEEIGILYNTFNPNINKTLQINKENIIYTKGNIKEV